MKQDEFLPFEMPEMNLECSMPSEIIQRRRNTITFHSCEFRKGTKWKKREMQTNKQTLNSKE